MPSLSSNHLALTSLIQQAHNVRIRPSSYHRNPQRSIRLVLIGLVLLASSFFPYAARADSDSGDRVWNITIKQNKVPGWLKMRGSSSDVYSEYQLPALTARLINVGLAKAPGCPGAGLKDSSKANPCGVKAAAQAEYEWQNRFNADIISASQETGVPPILLKNIFALESEFWPQAVYINTMEYGLGHMTEMGADSLLRWNYPFYDAFCTASLAKGKCEKVYVDQPPYIQATLRGLVLQQLNATCSNCAYGLDLDRTDRSVRIFAHTVIANTKLVKHYIKAYTGVDAADAATYEDLWDFTLASYNAGPGCFKTALARTYYSGMSLTWKNLSARLDPACQGAIPYVKFVSATDAYHPEDAPQTNPTATETVSPSPVATASAEATASPAPEASATPTALPTTIAPTDSATPLLATETAGPTVTASATESMGATPTVNATATVAETPSTGTPEGTAGVTDTATPTAVSTDTSPTPTATAAATSTQATPTAEQSSAGDPLAPYHVANELIVKVDPLQKDAALQTLKSAGVDPAQSSTQPGSVNTLIVQVQADKLATTLASLETGKGIEFAEPNYVAGISSFASSPSQPDDPLFASQTNLSQIQVPAAWSTVSGEQPVLVAVLDTGIDLTQPDLANSIWSNPGETGTDAAGTPRASNGLDDDGNGFVDDHQGWNFVDGNNNVSDDNGHGTHLAGIIAASINNGVGVAGIAPNARILPVKVLDKNGYGTYANIASGIVYATNMGARVINLGFGGTGSSAVLQDAVDYALLHNVLLVAAAGNGGPHTTYYPAGYSGVVAVSAVDGQNALAGFSSTGDDISLAAPGVGILSTGLNGTYVTMSGTSMAAAEVSGVAALLGGQPNFPDVIRLRSALLGGALDLGASGRDPNYGYGLVQAVGALHYSGPIFPITISQNGVDFTLNGGAFAMNTAPTVTITAPATGSTYAQGAAVSFSGTATDPEDGDLSAAIVWYSNLTGAIGTGQNVSSSTLMPGTHTITAQVTDSGGLKSSASITITINGSSGPHGGFNGSTEQCATCHRTHSATGDTYLTTGPGSMLTSDALCLSCHTDVSTHSNKNWSGAVEQPFELRCIQCHDAHGTTNLFNIRTALLTSLSPQTSSGPVVFTALTGPNSYDDGVSSNRLCVTCHTSMTNHPGGANHFDGTGYTLNYTGQSCVACHPHNADTSAITLDGFMPLRSTNP